MNPWRIGGWQQDIAAVPPYVLIPISALYLLFLRQLTKFVESFAYRLNAACFMCSFEETNWVFFDGEMHI